MADKTISAIGKASLVLAIISTAIRIITSIANAKQKAYEEQYKQDQQLLDIASKYNIALRQRNILLEQSKIIFGDNKYKESISYITEMEEATKALAVALEKVKKSKTTINTLTLVGGVQVLGKLNVTEKFKDLFDEGKFDVIKAQKILAESQYMLSAEAVRALEEAIAATEDYKKNFEALQSYLNSVLGDLGGGMMDAIINNLDSTKAALEEFTTYASSALEKLFRDIAYSMYLAPIFANLQKNIEEVYRTAEVDKGMDTATKILAVFEANKADLDAAAIKTQKFVQDLREASKRTSFPVFGDKLTDDTTANGIRGVTEDTARRLEGLINSIRQTQVINLGNTKSLVESNQQIQAYSAQSLAVLVNIEANTAKQLTAFVDVTTTASNTAGRALKVVMA